MDQNIKQCRLDYFVKYNDVAFGVLILFFVTSSSAQVTRTSSSSDATKTTTNSSSWASPSSIPSSANSTSSSLTSNDTLSTSASNTETTSSLLTLTAEVETGISLGNDSSFVTSTQSTSLSSSSLGNFSSPLPSSISNTTSIIEEVTEMATSFTTMGDVNTDTSGMTTILDGTVTSEMLTSNVTESGDGGGLLSDQFFRLVIIAGATAGSCIILLIVVFTIVVCYHRKQQQRRNARYYEFKKKDYKSKYERVEMQNSLARRDQPQNTPIGGGWVFSSGPQYHDYGDDDDVASARGGVALRSVSPILVATPLLKVPSTTTDSSAMLATDDLNGVPDSGHGGSIPPDDSALGFSASLEEELELELSPFYRQLGAGSIATGSEGAREHSHAGGESDTVSDLNEPSPDRPIRDVHFGSFGGKAKSQPDEQKEL